MQSDQLIEKHHSRQNNILPFFFPILCFGDQYRYFYDMDHPTSTPTTNPWDK